MRINDGIDDEIADVEMLENLDWIVVDHHGIHCLRCDEKFPITGLPIVAFPWVARGLQEAHKNCKEVENGTA